MSTVLIGQGRAEASSHPANGSENGQNQVVQMRREPSKLPRVSKTGLLTSLAVAVSVGIARVLSKIGLIPTVREAELNAVRYIKELGTIVQRDARPVRLIEIESYSRPFVFLPDDMRDVWCLMVDSSQFTVGSVISWMKETVKTNQEAGVPHLPSIIALADMRKLSRGDLRRISLELEPLGVVFVKWSDGAATKQEATDQIIGKMRSSYGIPDIENSPKWGVSLMDAADRGNYAFHDHQKTGAA